jgi:uncharacterized protein (DUF885 family)
VARSPSRRQLLTGGVAAAAAGATVLQVAEGRAQAAGPRAPTVDAKAKDRFTKAVNGYYDALFRKQPSVATSFGNHDYDHLLEDGSATKLDGNAAFYKEWLETLDKLRLELKLPPSRELNDLEALIGRIKGDILYSTKIEVWRKDPAFYPTTAHTAVSGMTAWIDKSNPPMDYAAKKRRDQTSKKLLANVIARLEAIPTLLNNGQQNIKDPPKALVRYAQKTLKDQIAFFETELPEAFASFSDDQLQGLRTANTPVKKAFADYGDYLEKLEKTTKGPEVFAITTAHLKEHFLCYELFEVDPEKLLEAAKLRLDREKADYIKLAETLIKKIHVEPKLKNADEVDKWVKRNLIPARDELIPTARRQLTLLKQFLIDKKLVTIPTLYPDYPPEYQGSRTQRKLPLDPEVADGGGWSCTGPGALEDTDSWRAVYGVTIPGPETKGDDLTAALAEDETNGLLITTAHEVWPGHFMQYLTALTQQENQSRARRCAWTVPGNATCEGWPHYAEQMVVDEGLGQYMLDNKWEGDADFLRFGMISNALLRTGRMIVDLSVQMEKITTVKAAEDFLRDQCFQAPALAKTEGERAAYWGVTDTSYAFGKMMVLKLRQDYEKAVAPTKERLRDFHDKLLNAGQVPLFIIRREIMPENAAWDGKMWDTNPTG